MQLKTMSLDRLIGLREKVETALNERIAGARSELESRLKKLADFGGSRETGRRGRRGRVPPKYRNPDSPGETWTGRGLPPRWLAAALKRGARLEDFLVAGASKRRRKIATKARRAKAERKQAKPRKAAAKARGATKQRKAAKTRKPSRAKMTRRPRASPEAPVAASAGQSSAPTPAA
jgi:DNA-binding protein H-NS